MIDNRPKVHSRRHVPSANNPAEPPRQAEIREPTPAPAAPPVKAPARAKAMGMPAGLSGLLSNLGGSLGGLGGISGILPVVLVVGAMSQGRGLAPAAKAKPAVEKPKLAALPAANPPPESAKAESQTGRKPRRALNEKALPAPVVPQQPEPEPPPRPEPAYRPAPKPAEIKNLLGDLAGYLPGAGSASAAKISRIIGIADELKSLGSENETYTASTTEDPLNRHIGLLNVLSRNLPMAGASNLGRASQVLSLVNTLRGSGQGLGGLGALGNMGGMANMLRSAMNTNTPPASAPEMKNITPQQADGIKDTVNRLLGGMDDKQKNELLDKAKSFLGKR